MENTINGARGPPPPPGPPPDEESGGPPIIIPASKVRILLYYDKYMTSHKNYTDRRFHVPRFANDMSCIAKVK